MNGTIYPPIGQRDRQQFVTIDVDATQKTYSRGCTVVRGDFIIVRVPLDADGEPDKSKLSESDRRFVEQNITPAEWAAAVNSTGLARQLLPDHLKEAIHGDANVSGGIEEKENPGGGD